MTQTKKTGAKKQQKETGCDDINQDISKSVYEKQDSPSKVISSTSVESAVKKEVTDCGKMSCDRPESPSFRAVMGIEPQLCNQDYLDQLMRDKETLRQLPISPFQHVYKLLDKEISRVLSQMSAEASSSSESESDENLGEKVNLTETIMVPVDKYPRYNFVGRILGPRGMTAKQLEDETGCKIMVRGRGSSRLFSGGRRERGNDGEPLHVLIQCEDYKHRAQIKMKNAIAEINQLLHPPPEGKDELKRKQLIELSIINGTYRPTTATKVALQSPRPSAAAHLPSTLDSPQFSDARLFSSLMDSSKINNSSLIGQIPSSLRRNDVMSNEDNHHQMSQLAQLLTLLNANPMQQPAISPLTAEYFKQLQMSMDPNVFSMMGGQQHMDVFSSMAPMMGQQHSSGSGSIPQANMQQYMQAAALLNPSAFLNEGAGDSPLTKSAKR